MKIFRLKINSSVIVVNLGVVLAALATLALGWVTDNQALLESILTPAQLLTLSAVQGIVTMILRSTNVTGAKPIEVLPKNAAKVDSEEASKE